MIIMQLKGGLGNQLFQYAFSRSLAKDLNEELVLDISYFNHGRPKHVVYGLHPYNIKAIVGNYQMSDITFMSLEDNFQKSNVHYYNQAEPYTKWGHYISEMFEHISEIKTPAYIDGFFQTRLDALNKVYITENFFKHNAKTIHDDLKYLQTVSPESNEIIEDMSKYDAIALHIRHGDYVGLLDFGLCSKEYYQNAIDFIASKVENPKFFIFTEDHEWVVNNLKIKYPSRHIVFTEKAGTVGRGYAELLKVMSSCDHFILANSTFSWWGAFLGENKDKIIIVPEPWFQSRRYFGVDTIDNKIPISIPNNDSMVFNESDKIVFKIDEDNFDYVKLNFIKVGDSFKFFYLNNESKFYLKNDFNQEGDSKFILKISIESDCFNCLKIFFKTKFDQDYSDKNSVSVYYYDNDMFDYFFILPEGALLDSMMIKPASIGDTQSSLIIHSLEIKSFN